MFVYRSALLMIELDTQADSTRTTDTRLVVVFILGIESTVENSCVSLGRGICRQGMFPNVHSSSWTHFSSVEKHPVPRPFTKQS